MRKFALLSLLATMGSGCMVTDTLATLRRNREAVEESTAAIERNIEAIEQANAGIEENRRQLDAINVLLEAMGQG